MPFETREASSKMEFDKDKGTGKAGAGTEGRQGVAIKFVFPPRYRYTTSVKKEIKFTLLT